MQPKALVDLSENFSIEANAKKDLLVKTNFKKHLKEAIDPLEAKRKAAELAQKEAIRKQKELEKQAAEQEKKRKEEEERKEDELRAKIQSAQLKRSAEALGLGPATISGAAKTGSAFLAKGGGDFTDKLMGGAIGGGLGVARSLGATVVGAIPGALKLAKPIGATVLGTGIAAGSTAARAAADAARKIKEKMPQIKAGAAKVGSSVKSGASRLFGAAKGLVGRFRSGFDSTKKPVTSSYDYAPLMTHLSSLNEQQIQQLKHSLDQHHLELVETAIELNEMGPGYNRLRARLAMKFNESRSTVEDPYGDIENPSREETTHVSPWNRQKSVGPWGPKGSKGKRITLRSHRTGDLPKGRKTPEV